ncbi:Exportin-T [Candida viswanathii]|uniref:Exportin-T n=1 Tax=Candida viswanathii TaxID=5486 RepID=A0A367YHY7_9ASCO|nr:Exportin-T [Candida viswanathii]
MEQEITQAVEIALSGTADPALKTQAFDFINQIKSTPEGYKSCLDILVKSSTSSINEGLKFFIYQVIDENIELQQEIKTDEQLYALNQQIFKILNDYVNYNVRDSTFLMNKLAQIFAKLFCRVYWKIHPNFIKDLFALIEGNNQLAVDYYTRILLAIHLEIGDKYIARSQEIQERNNVLKDCIRVNDMQQLVSSWIKILSDGSNSDEILDNTLKIVGLYVSWMDIGLFVSPGFISSIFGYLTKEQQRNTTCETLTDIISKKMPPSNKLELIALLNLTDIINSLDLTDDIEFLEYVCKLLNQIGQELLIVMENDPNLIQQVNSQLFKLWPSVFTFLGHDYDDVSQHIFPFIQQFLGLSKKYRDLYNLELMSTLLNKIILKMKYDEDDDGVLDEDAQSQFLDFRSKLKIFHDTIAALEPDLYLNVVPVVINESIFDGSNSNTNWRKIELGLFELNNFSDTIRMNVFQIPKKEIDQSKPYAIFQEFLIKLINSDFILKINHPEIQSGFFELVVKHYNFLSNKDDLIIRILETFTSPLGLFNDFEKVRLRSWYLFFRFMKLTKPKLSNEALIESIVVKLQPLLVVKAELPTRDEDDDVVENGNFNNQQYLFETMGLLISLIPDEMSLLKLKLIDLIFQPLFNDLERCISIAEPQRDPLVVLQAHHSLMAIGTVVRGYDYENGLKFSPEVVDKINNAAQVVLITLENFPKHEIIRDAASSHLTKLIAIIWSASNLKISELSDFLSFLGQIVHNYQKDENIYQLLNNFVTPLVQKVFEYLEKGISEDDALRPDIIRDKNSLKKAILNFISSLVLNHCSSLLITETNRQELPEIMNKIISYALDLSDPSTSRTAVLQITNFVNIFGNGGKLEDGEDKYSTVLPPVLGIDTFLMDKVINLSFELPFNNADFNLNDAQYRLIAQELAVLLKSFEMKNSEEVIKNLSSYLINMGMSQEMCNDFCSNLKNLQLKDFKKYFVTFVSNMKGK